MKPPINRHRWIVAAVLLTFLAGNYLASAQELPTVKPEDVGVSAEKVAELSRFMQSLVDDGKIAGGVTMMARRGKVVHLEAVGMTDRDSGKPMTTDAIFRIASMTKPVTSVAIMMLWEEGKLDLDDPVSKFIPEFGDPKVLVSVEPLETRPAKREITIRHLLTHTSGLTYDSPKLKEMYQQQEISGGLSISDVTLEEMMRRLGGLPLLFDPGDDYEYGMSTDVLGRVVEVASGMALDQFLQERIFTPLGMNDTFFKVPPEKAHRLTAVYVADGAGIKQLESSQDKPSELDPDYPLSDAHVYLSGGGGLCSTASDYLRFCQMLLNGGENHGVRLLKEDTIKLMRMDQTGPLGRNFGFGFTVFPETEDVHEQLQGAYAWFGHWSTSFRISPRGEWAIVTMSQLQWTDETPKWFAQYERLAAEAVVE